MVPSKFKTFEDSQANNINPDFLCFEQQDQLIISSLLTSMSTPFLTKMVGLETVVQIWTRLNTCYAY